MRSFFASFLLFLLLLGAFFGLRQVLHLKPGSFQLDMLSIGILLLAVFSRPIFKWWFNLWRIV